MSDCDDGYGWAGDMGRPKAAGPAGASRPLSGDGPRSGESPAYRPLGQPSARRATPLAAVWQCRYGVLGVLLVGVLAVMSMPSKSAAPDSRTAAAPAADIGGIAAAEQPQQFSSTGLVQMASATATCSSPQVGMNNGVNLERQTAGSVAECCDKCLALPECKGYTLLEGGDCWLKSKLDPVVSDGSATSGSVGNEPEAANSFLAPAAPVPLAQTQAPAAQAQAPRSPPPVNRQPSSRATAAPLQPPPGAGDAGLSPAGVSEGHTALGPERSLRLLGKTLRMRLDVSQLPCGCVGGVYLVESGDGGQCDASGYFPGRCGEIDLMEGNQFSWHSTLHNGMDQAGLCGGFGGVGQPDQNYGQGPRDMTGEEYGPGGSIIDTTRSFHAAVSFPQNDDGSLVDMVVMLYQDGMSSAIEWRVNKRRADLSRTPPLDCEDGSCPNCFSKPGCQYKDGDLQSFGSWLSQGMTPLSTYWEGDGNNWLDGVLGDERGGCALDGQGVLGTPEKGHYAGGSGCNGASYTIDEFTLEDISRPGSGWEALFADMDANPVIPQ